MKQRLFYYGTLVPLLTMFGLMYAEYQDGKQLAVDTQKAANRQIELLTLSSQSRIDDQSMRHMAIVHKLQCSQQHDIDALITHYSTVIDEIRAGGSPEKSR